MYDSSHFAVGVFSQGLLSERETIVLVTQPLNKVAPFTQDAM